MENNLYLFIIWHKALWCKNKIIKDLSESFEILNDITVNWSNDEFARNLLSLYGRKLGSPEEKIQPCGKGPFCVLLIKDKNPKFELRKMYDGDGLVNSHIYDKKMLYRKWTGGCHRIHCSDTYEETLHDLVVLFGPNYKNIVNNNTSLSLNSKTVNGFNSVDDLIESLVLFGNNKVILKDNGLYIFTKCRYDIVSFIGCDKIDSNNYSLTIDKKLHNLFIFGELDGDLPESSFLDDNFNNLIINNFDSYIKYLNNNQKLPEHIKIYADNKKYDLNLKKINVARFSKKESFYKALLKDIKLLICRIKYSV